MSSKVIYVNTLNGITIGTSPAAAAGVTIGASSDNKAGATVGALSVASSLLTIVKTIPGLNGSLAVISLGINLNQANQDIGDSTKNYRVDDNTMMSLASDAMAITALAATAALATTIASPIIFTAAAVSSVAAVTLSLAAAVQDDNSTDISDTWLAMLDTALDMTNDFDLTDAMNDLLNGTPTTAPLPGLDDFNYIDPNNPANPNPNTGNPLNTPTPTNPDDGIPPNHLNAPTPPRHDPLVLDSDKDGFISTVALADSNTYFDITGDGIKEKVSWIAANDGILTYDKNENGKIDGINEVFGNLTTSGFDELKELIDSNHDGVIDRKDELYSRLKVWHDDNGDGISQIQELVSLKDEDVKSINVGNVVATDIELGSATLSEASKYTDSQGNKELAADVKLEYNPTLTTIDTATIPDYSVDLDTLTLPNLRGYGLM